MGWYERPDLYDLVFAWDPSAEREFVLGASARWGIPQPQRILEPFCGTGRLLRAMPGRAIGLDFSAAMLARAPEGRVFRADAARFGVRAGSFDLAFSLIDSFRHLLTGEAAAGHLACVARALRPGAVYVLGLDVTEELAGRMGDEWEEERGGVRVRGAWRSHGGDPATRIETAELRLEAGGETEGGFATLRTYTWRQLEDLIDGEASFEIAAVYDRRYDLARPLEISEARGSAVLVLARP